MKEIKPELETFARIKVIGVGGGGNHAISRMAEANLKGIDFIAVNTDAQTCIIARCLKNSYRKESYARPGCWHESGYGTPGS